MLECTASYVIIQGARHNVLFVLGVEWTKVNGFIACFSLLLKSNVYNVLIVTSLLMQAVLCFWCHLHSVPVSTSRKGFMGDFTSETTCLMATGQCKIPCNKIPSANTRWVNRLTSQRICFCFIWFSVATHYMWLNSQSLCTLGLMTMQSYPTPASCFAGLYIFLFILSLLAHSLQKGRLWSGY